MISHTELIKNDNIELILVVKGEKEILKEQKLQKKYKISQN